MKISIDASAFKGMLGTLIAELRSKNCDPMLLKILGAVDTANCNLQSAASALYPLKQPAEARTQIISDAKQAIGSIKDEGLKAKVLPIAHMMEALDPDAGPEAAIKGLQAIVNDAPVPFALKAGVNTVLGGVKYE